MTREDLLKGNAEIAAQLGKDIKAYCPDLKHLTVIFNPADIRCPFWNCFNASNISLLVASEFILLYILI